MQSVMCYLFMCYLQYNLSFILLCVDLIVDFTEYMIAGIKVH